MNDAFFYLEWNNLMDASGLISTSYKQELKEATIKYPSKKEIQSYYSQQINMLTNSIMELGFPVNQNLSSLREKLMRDYLGTQKYTNLEIVREDDLKELTFFRNLIEISENIIEKINDIETQLNESSHDQKYVVKLIDILSIENIKNIKLFSAGFSTENYILEAKINSWIDTLETIYERIAIEVKNQELNQETTIIRTMVIHDDLSYGFQEGSKKYELSSYSNLLESIVSEIRKEIKEIKISSDVDQMYEVRSFLSDKNIGALIKLRCKVDALVEYSDIRFLNKKRSVTFEEKIKDKKRLELIILDLIQRRFVLEEDGTYHWNGLNNKNIESLAAFANVLEKEKVMGHFSTGKSAFEAYSSIFHNSTDTSDYFTRFYNKPQEVFDLELEFSFIRDIK